MVNTAFQTIARHGAAASALRIAGVLLLVLLVGLRAAHAQGPGLTAFVDRTDIAIDDIITLTLRIDSSLAGTRPQFSGLNREFEQVGGISSRSTYTNNNGNIQSWTEYSIMLRPLTTGVLTIPAFRMNGQVSTPIQINVGEARQATGDGNSEIFLRTTVSKDSVYVQEQLLYTIRIYWSITFDQGAQLTSPQVADAVVQQLGTDDNRQELVNGINYNVTERKFVIFPQASGQLVIPPVYFAASIGRRGFNRLLPNSRAPVREINLVSETHNIEVKPQPATYPAGATWLPATELTLEEDWSGDFDSLTVGDALTRNVTMIANGLSSSLLPGITYQNQPGLRFYPDQPVREDSADGNGVRGRRSEGTAMVASEAGDFTLAEVRVPWWNTRTDSLETAVLPARMISVQPSSASDSRPGVFTDSAGVSTTGLQPAAAGSATGGTGASLVWMATTALFAAAWAFTTFLWLRSRQQLEYAETVGTPGVPRLPDQREKPGTAAGHQPDADACLRVLKTACESGNLRDVRTALVKWGRAISGDGSLQTLESLDHYWDEEALGIHLRALDAALYGGGGKVDCKEIYSLAAALHKQGRPATNNDRYALPPLYRQ